MKTKLFLLMLIVVVISLIGCEEDKQRTLPVVTTSAIADITSHSASGGGDITSNGNTDVTASGLCWSSMNATPTIDDDTTKTDTKMGTFTSMLRELQPSTTYHVRAYAINNVGVGYGDVVDFTTNNAFPVATAVTITGVAQVAAKLTGNYSYSDVENDVESGSVFKWYIANDAAGSGESAIAGATAITYVVKASDEFKYIRFGVTPVAATGNALGVEVKSAFVGPIAAGATTLTFTYNGQLVTYGIIISPVTGRSWLDRNMGAPNMATTHDDFVNYGDMFQWGRAADGHQLVNRGSTNATTTAVNGTTMQTSSSDNPGNALFILPPDPYDWRNPKNDNLWRGVNRPNNPCPLGWHVPDSTEWVAENILNVMDGYTKLKLTAGGTRNPTTGAFATTTSRGSYWTSTITEGSNFAVAFDFTATAPSALNIFRAQGRSCRCVKD